MYINMNGCYLFFAMLGTGCSNAAEEIPKASIIESDINMKDMETATFGNGCFWCTEAVFESLNGVHSAVSGYSGGHIENPTYKQVCTGETGHAEVIQIKYDPVIISFENLLEAFWAS